MNRTAARPFSVVLLVTTSRKPMAA